MRRIYSLERTLWARSIRFVAGVDEAGRGPLAGPVVAAAVVLDRELNLDGLNDSKCVPKHLRAKLAVEIKKAAAGWGIGIAPVGCIERCNVLKATFMAMYRAIEHLKIRPEYVLIDGSFPIPGLDLPQTAIIQGDQKSAAIAAASILAKTTRDAIMEYYGRLYPKYDFARNKGYPPRAHLQALKEYGPCFLHRRTFRGVTGVKGKVDDDCR